MSVNQISPELLWWTHPTHQQQMNPADHNSNSILFAHHFQNFNLNHPNHDDDDDRPGSNRPVAEVNNNNGGLHHQLEVMFEKPLTPSDVGKLNRLVIPKQHAERHFPLNTSNGAESGGMLLTFEDEIGKLWRFRYSYWNSSQSYVLTKGWSRYVKEKRLDAGDVVFFQRHPTDQDRLFIAWRRRQDSTAAIATPPAVGGAGFYPAHHYQPDPEASAGVDHRRTASFNGSSSSRTLRLFGVNMEYQFESDQSEPATPDGSWTSSPSGQHYSQFYPQGYHGTNSYIVQQDGRHRG